MKQFKTANAVACEYVALGSNNKHTLVNVYGGDIIVREFPARVPLAFYIEILPDRGMPSRAKLQVLQNKKLRAEIDAEFEFEPGKLAAIILPQLPYVISKDTTVRVVAECEGYSRTTLLKKTISVGEIPTNG